MNFVSSLPLLKINEEKRGGREHTITATKIFCCSPWGTETEAQECMVSISAMFGFSF